MNLQRFVNDAPLRRRKRSPRSCPSRKKIHVGPSRRKSPCVRELTTKRRGELAELTFTLKAASLGFGVARPFGDSERYDAILDARELSPRRRSLRKKKTKKSEGLCAEPSMQKNIAGNKVTEKKKRTPTRKPIVLSATFSPDPSPPLWRVQVKCSTQLSEGLYHLNAHRRSGGRAVPYLPGEIHFLAAYIIPEDTWYIIPLQAFLGRSSLLFRRRRDHRPGLYDAYREAWHLLRPKCDTRGALR
jgi:hypothetical protein